MKVLARPTPPSPLALDLERPATRRIDSFTTLALCALALSLGLGDIARTNPLTSLTLDLVHALLPLAICLALLATLQARRAPKLPTRVAVPIVLWLAILVTSAAFAESHQADALAALIRPVSGVLLAWAVADACRFRETWLRLLRALSLGGLIVAAVALAEATGLPAIRQGLDALQDGSVPIGDVPRVAATLSHPNEAAMLLELTLPLLLAWTWTTSSRWRLALFFACMATLLALVLTFSRAGLLATGAGLVILAVFAARRSGHHTRRRLTALGTVLLVVPLALAWTAVVDPGLDRRLLAGLDESSSVQPPRTQFWTVALDMTRDHPLLGVGPDNFRWLFANYSGTSEDNLGIHAHDQYLEALADTGIVGLIGLVWLLAALMQNALQRARAVGSDWPWRAALLASLSEWLVHALLDDFERFWPTSVVFWLLVGLSLSRARASVDYPQISG
jgi:O-antigen ligase